MLDFVSSFHLPKRSHRFARASIVATVVLVSWAPGCRRSPSELAGETASVRREIPALNLVPPDARILLSLDLDRLRAEAVWKTILSALVRDTSPRLGAVLGGSGLNLTERLHHVLVALPGERQADNRFAVIADGDGLDDAPVTTWLRKQIGQSAVALVRDHHRLVVGNGAWIQAMASLATASKLTQSVADNPELRRLCERTAGGHGFWFAAVVPARVRRDIVQQDRFPDAASVMRVSGLADADAGLHAELVAELSNTGDAVHLAHRLTVFLNQAKRHPQMLVLGLSPYLEAVHLEARDASVKASIELPAAQLGEVIERIEALAHGAWTK